MGCHAYESWTVEAPIATTTIPREDCSFVARSFEATVVSHGHVYSPLSTRFLPLYPSLPIEVGLSGSERGFRQHQAHLFSTPPPSAETLSSGIVFSPVVALLLFTCLVYLCLGLGLAVRLCAKIFTVGISFNVSGSGWDILY